MEGLSKMFLIYFYISLQKLTCRKYFSVRENQILRTTHFSQSTLKEKMVFRRPSKKLRKSFEKSLEKGRKSSESELANASIQVNI